MRAKEVCAFVQRTFEVDYTPNAMTKLLKRLDFVYKKPKCVPAKADAAVQEQFAKETLLPLMAQANADTPLYFVDGMHPSYTAHPGFGENMTAVSVRFLPTGRRNNGEVGREAASPFPTDFVFLG